MRARRRDNRSGLRPAAWLAILLAGGWLASCAPAEVARPVRPPSLKPLHSWAEAGQIRLDWEPLRGAASYTLYWSDAPGVAERRDNPIAGIKSTSYLHKGLRDGAPYYYYLVGVARDGSELPAFAPVSDIPYRHEVRRYRGLLAVVPRLHDTFESLAGQYLGDSSKGWVIRDFNGLEAVTPYRALLIPTDPYLPGGLSEQGYRMVPVLVYHHLSRIKASRMSVPVTEFELQMAYLKRNRYQVISLEQLADFLEFKGQVPARSVVITFDDGWTSTYQYALPILKRYGFKATLFVYTDLVGSQRQALSWEQLQEIEESGVIDVQCHTKSHRNLNRQPEEDLPAYLKALEQELRDSRALLQRKIGKECRYLAYPYGATNHLVVALAEKFGYRAAFTVDRGPNPFFVTNFRVLRSMVYGDFDLKAFAANLATFGDQVLK